MNLPSKIDFTQKGSPKPTIASSSNIHRHYSGCCEYNAYGLSLLLSMKKLKILNYIFDYPYQGSFAGKLPGLSSALPGLSGGAAGGANRAARSVDAEVCHFLPNLIFISNKY